MKLEGKVTGAHIAAEDQGLSSIRIQTDPKRPNALIIFNCEKESAKGFAVLVDKFVSITVEETTETPAPFRPPVEQAAVPPAAPAANEAAKG